MITIFIVGVGWVGDFDYWISHGDTNYSQSWWSATKYLYANLSTLEEDFSAFLRAYLYTIVKAKILEEDLIEAAQDYCQLITDICRKRFDQNSILVEVEGKQENVKMFKVKEATYYRKLKKSKETEYHPELLDIEICDLSNIGFATEKIDRASLINGLDNKVIKYIPLLFYDDLLECMLQNIKRLDKGDKDLIDPSFLLDNKIIITQNSKDLEKINIESYSWWNSFDTINLKPILESIRITQEQFIHTFDFEEFNSMKRRF